MIFICKIDIIVFSKIFKLAVTSYRSKASLIGDHDMSIFVFDDETTRMIHYLLAIRRFKDYQIGPLGLTPQLCAIGFEKMLIQTALRYPKYQKTKPHEMGLEEIIRFLRKNDLVTAALGMQLYDYLAFHNSILTGANVCPEKTNEVLLFLCTQANVKPDAEIPNKTFHDIATLKMNAPSAESRLCESDFDNLESLYPKCLGFQQEIQKRLTTPLRAAQPSAFTPNTGGIWLPFIKQDKQVSKEPVDGASLGVALAPFGVRIGLNFGSRAYNARIRYYELLLNGNLNSIFEGLHRKATGYCLCDTFWHYHVRNLQSLQWCLTLYGSTKVAIEQAMDETKQQEGTLLTGHRYLVSKVIERRPEDFAYILQGIVNMVPKALDELYPILEKFG